MIYGEFVKRIVFPVSQRLFVGPTLDYIAEWEKSQWLPCADLQSMQLEKLRKMLEHCAASVPYYRRTWKEIGFKPGDVRRLSDLPGLPVLDKAVLREQTSEFVTEGITENLYTARTGGSTGEPLAFPVGSSLRAASAANTVRCRRWWGIDVGDRSANLWGHSRYVEARPMDRVKKALSTAKARLLNRIVCSAYDLSEESMERYWRRIERFHPVFLIGYATSLYVFADFVLRKGLSGKALALKGVISTAEVLYDWQEETIRSAFGCPVINEYGMCEVGIIAYQCPSHSMHVMDETLIVEILPGDGGSDGEIVITELDNVAAPLIRYNTGDVASRIEGPCACGRGLSRISKVAGRAYDIIYAADGKVVAGALLTHVMKKTSGIGKYQIVQKDLKTLDITYTQIGPFGDAERDAVVRTLHNYLGREAQITLTRVDDIPAERSGKHRWLRSLVRPDDVERMRGKSK